MTPELKNILAGVRARLTREIPSYKTTVRRMFALAQEYAADLLPWAHLSVFEFYNLVRALPYKADPVGVETIIRPRYTVRPDWPLWRDCDDKAILILAFCFLKGYVSRLACVGERATVFVNGRGWIPAGPHHVYPEVQLSGEWVPFDATYDDRCILGGRLYMEAVRKEFYGPALG